MKRILVGCAIAIGFGVSRALILNRQDERLVPVGLILFVIVGSVCFALRLREDPES